MSNPEFHIKEDSWIAKIAAKKLHAESVAMVIGKTIYLYGSSKENFLADKRWVRHELCHIKQYRENGTVRFLIKYLWESFKVGYYNNKFEVEARAAENQH